MSSVGRSGMSAERAALLGATRGGDVERGSADIGRRFFGTNTIEDDDDAFDRRASDGGSGGRGRSVGTIAVSVLFLVVGMVMATTTRERGLEGTDAKSDGRNGAQTPSAASIRAGPFADSSDLGAHAWRNVRVPSDSWISYSSGIVRKRRFPDSFYYVTSPTEAASEVGSLGVSTPGSAWPTGNMVTIDLHTGCSPISMLPIQKRGFDFDNVQAKFVSKKMSMEFKFGDAMAMTKVGCGHFRATVELAEKWEFGFYLHPAGDDSDENSVLDIGCEAAVTDPNNATKCPDFASPAALATSSCTEPYTFYDYTFWNRKYDGQQTTFLWGACGDSCSQQDCGHMYCPANKRVQNLECVACPPGMTNDSGDKNVGADTQCDPIICTAHMRVQDHACVACIAGKENEAGDDASGANTQCDTVVCGANHHVSNNMCTACPDGHAHAGGDVQHGPDTSCDEVLCHTNEHVQSHACVACPAGSTNDAGDGAASGDTVCDHTICGANTHVLNHVCTACPPGHDHPGGDDATGADTSCSAIMCGANQRVQNHVCTACPAGTTNAAGDDASGADTQCV